MRRSASSDWMNSSILLVYMCMCISIMPVKYGACICSRLGDMTSLVDQVLPRLRQSWSKIFAKSMSLLICGQRQELPCPSRPPSAPLPMLDVEPGGQWNTSNIGRGVGGGGGLWGSRGGCVSEFRVNRPLHLFRVSDHRHFFPAHTAVCW